MTPHTIFSGQDVVTNLMAHPTSKQTPGAQLSYPHSPRGLHQNPSTTIATKPISPHPHPPPHNQSLSPSSSVKALHRRKSTTIVSPPTSMLDAPTYKLIHGGGAGILGNGSTTSLSNQQGYLRSEHPSEVSLISEKGSRYR